MTSAQSMQPRLPPLRAGRLRLGARSAALAIINSLLMFLGGCAQREVLHPAPELISPYPGAQVWAIAPFANESGVSIVQGERIADVFAHEAEQIRGVNAVAVNRVIAAMRQMKIAAINSPADAQKLMNVLGVDALIVGTVTAYEPYPPPKLGAAIQLFRRGDDRNGSELDPVAMTRATADDVRLGELSNDELVAQASGVYDAANHGVLAQLDEYAAGRTEPGSAYGKKVYLVSMELYTQFVAHRLMHDLLAFEQARLTPMAMETTPR